MSAVEPARERIARRLQDAVDRLRHDMDEVEFWSEVLATLARPAPDYETTTLLDRFSLPLRSPDPSARPDRLDTGDKASEERLEHASGWRHSRH